MIGALRAQHADISGRGCEIAVPESDRAGRESQGVRQGIRRTRQGLVGVGLDDSPGPIRKASQPEDGGKPAARQDSLIQIEACDMSWVRRISREHAFDAALRFFLLSQKMKRHPDHSFADEDVRIDGRVGCDLGELSTGLQAGPDSSELMILDPRSP
jgi:hypothetical protein